MRILFVATLFSPLAARWINQVTDLGWEVFCYGTSNVIHPDFSNLKIYYPSWPLPHGRGRGKFRRFFPKLARSLGVDPPEQLAQLIARLKPDIVHSLKTQDEAYHVLDAARILGGKLPCTWIHSLWGSDIYRWGNHVDHVDRIRAVLSTSNYLMADNPRDIQLALDHGFVGEILGVFPGGGGYPIDNMQKYVRKLPSQRRIIAIKGYQAECGGQVLTALEAIKQCGAIFAGYHIVIHSAIGTYASSRFEEVRAKATEASQICNVPIEFLPYSPPERIWELFGDSRVAIAVSNSDGTPNAMLEAMTMGAFPIQSDTGGLESWIESGINGFLIPFDNVKDITQAIVKAITDDELVDAAASLNTTKTRERLNRNTVKAQVEQLYTGIVKAKYQEDSSYV